MVHPLAIRSNEDARDNGWTVEFGPEDKSGGNGWVLVQKAMYEDEDEMVMHTTKKLVVENGFLYEIGSRVTTLSGPGAGITTMSKAVTFVPYAL